MKNTCHKLKHIPTIHYGLSYQEETPLLYVQSETPLRTLNSSIWGGGFGDNRYLINRQVANTYMSDDPTAEMQEFLDHAGYVSEDCAALLTAAWVDYAGFCEMQLDELAVASWVSVGLGNAARAGDPVEVDKLYVGTINSIVLIAGQLNDCAMVNAVITATEAKCAFLQDTEVYVAGSGDRIATGTSTDAVLIAATNSGQSYTYAGTSTRLGYLIGRTVYMAGEQAVRAYKKWQAENGKS